MFVTIARRASAHGSGMYSCFASRRRAPSSSSCGLFVAPTSSNRPVNNSRSICQSFENKRFHAPSSPPRPSICTKNSVFIRRELSCSPSDLRALSNESISSTNITAGSQHRATANNARTIFSPSPIHLLVKLDAEML